MRILKRMLRQKAVYWAPGGLDKFGQKFELPIEIKCRWEDAAYVELAGTDQETIYKSTVYVDRPVLQKGMLWRSPDRKEKNPLASLDHLKDDDGNIDPPNDANEIRTVEEFPSLKAKQFLQIAKL